MKYIIKTLKYAIPAIIAILVSVGAVYAIGSLTPQGTAGDDTFYSLKDIEDKLTNFSDTPTATSSPFTVPGSVTASFPTLAEIYNLLTAENSDLVAGNIADGVEIFGVEGTLIEGTVLRSEWSADDQGSGSVNWSDADTACLALSENGNTDWELPTSMELHNAFLNSVSDFQSIGYWSSTDVPDNPSYAYLLGMDNGNIGDVDKTNPEFLVRCVR
jgi:hypothetical protein